MGRKLQIDTFSSQVYNQKVCDKTPLLPSRLSEKECLLSGMNKVATIPYFDNKRMVSLFVKENLYELGHKVSTKTWFFMLSFIKIFPFYIPGLPSATCECFFKILFGERFAAIKWSSIRYSMLYCTQSLYNVLQISKHSDYQQQLTPAVAALRTKFCSLCVTIHEVVQRDHIRD